MKIKISQLSAIMVCASTILLWACAPSLGQDEATAEIAALRQAAMTTISTTNTPAVDVNKHTITNIESYGSNQNLINFFAMQITLLAVVLILHTYTGMHIIRRGIIFCDLVLDQLAAFGIVAGIALGIKYGTPASYAMAMSATLVGCILLAIIKPKNTLISNEAVIGIMYGIALVACLLLADKMPSGGTDLKNTLVGSMSWVSWQLICVTAGVYIVLLLFHYKFRKNIIKFTESSYLAPGRTMWDFLFFLSQGIITILIVPVAGVLLAYGFLMIPASIAIMFTRKWKTGLLLGWSCGIVACILGLFFSYKTDSPYGPSLMLAMGLFFLAALLIRCLLPTEKGTRS